MVELFQPQPSTSGGSVDVTDRAGRLLGVVTIDGQPVTVTGDVRLVAPLDEDGTAVLISGTVDVDASTRDWQDTLAELQLRQTLALEAIALAMTSD